MLTLVFFQMKKIFKEPLFHFLFIGASLFLIYSLVNKRNAEDEIVIDNYVINELATKWQMQSNREPTFVELKALIDLYIEQEVLYREALAMNFDHNDEIIKRRLAKKMEFIADDLAESLQPTDEMLTAYYNKNSHSYARPSVYTFKQAFFNAQKRESALEDAVEALENELPGDSGDPLSLPSYYSDTDALKISIDFGKAFSNALDTLPLQKWTGPVRSGFGVHLVFIEAKKSSGIYTFDEVKEKVNIDYNFHASNEFRKELVSSLLKDYKISFELSDTQLKQELIESF